MILETISSVDWLPTGAAHAGQYGRPSRAKQLRS